MSSCPIAIEIFFHDKKLELITASHLLYVIYFLCNDFVEVALFYFVMFYIVQVI